MRKIIFVAALMATTAQAGITLPNYVTDNMIVQQNSTFKVTGHAAPGSKVKVIAGWQEKAIETKADKAGAFAVSLSTPPAGGPYSIVFSDKDGGVVLENVLSGEVWLCSGQSNMEFPVEGWGMAMDFDHESSTAFHPDIRLLQVRKATAFAPQEDVQVNMGGWQICSPASVSNFSAIAYFYARELSQRLGVPVGVIDTTWGGTTAEAWTSAEALGAVPGFENELADLKASGYDGQKLKENYATRLSDWDRMIRTSRLDFDKSKLQGGKTITVPDYWEESGLNLDGIVWLQKGIDIPAELAGKELTLNFAAIDDDDITYFNGRQVGATAGCNIPRNYTVPASDVKPGTNVITVRVCDFGGVGGFAPGVCEAVIDGQKINLAGEWEYIIDTDYATLPMRPISPDGPNYPSVLYNAMLSPLKDMPIKGVLWYQGCANVGRAEQYNPLFKALINNWRQLWGENLPFYFVQLAGWLQPRAVHPDSEWAALRDAQAKALELDNTAMAVAIDLGNPADIHPKNKQEVAHRLALISLARDYGRDEVYEAPKCLSAVADGNSILLTFDKPVKPTTNAITGFIIAGTDGKFTTATPVLEDETHLRLSSPAVKTPKVVKYNWADFPCGNLYGETGLPVAPFSNE